MTTIAVKDGVMACDSQVTAGCILGTNFRKVFRVADCYVGLSGTVNEAMTFLEWYKGNKTLKPNMEKVSALEMDCHGNCNQWEGDNKGNIYPLPMGKVGATGSGHELARGAMEFGASAKQAVEVAIKLDQNSGGKVRVYHKVGHV